MDLWQLKIFFKVAELKGFSKAADAINITQPTVSAHIRDLEDHFGCRLFDRMGKEVLLTAAGEFLLGHVKKILASCDEAETAMSEFSGRIRGRLRLGGSTIPGNYILPRLLSGFTSQYPGARIALRVSDTREIANMILEGSLDMGIIGARIEKARLVYKKLISDEMCVAVPADHRWAQKKMIDVDELSSEPFLIRERGSGTLKSLEKSLASIGMDTSGLNITTELGSTESIIEGIKAGLGVSVLSTIAIKEDLESGKLAAVKVSGLDLKRDFYITVHRHKSPSPLCTAFDEYITERLARPETGYNS